MTLITGIIGTLLFLAPIAIWYLLYYSFVRVILAFLFHRTAHKPRPHVPAPAAGHGHGHGGGHAHGGGHGHHHSPIEDNTKELWQRIVDFIEKIQNAITRFLQRIFGRWVTLNNIAPHRFVAVLLLLLAILSAWIGYFWEFHEWNMFIHFAFPAIAIGIAIIAESMWHHRPWNKHQQPSHGKSPTNEQFWFFLSCPILIIIIFYLLYHFFHADNGIWWILDKLKLFVQRNLAE